MFSGKIGVVGAGAIGCLLAGRLAPPDQAVTLLGRREDVLREIKAKGIDIIGADGGLSKIETSPLNSIKSIGAFDILFLCTFNVAEFKSL